MTSNNKTVYLHYEDEIKERLDKYLSLYMPEMSRSKVQKLIEEGCVQVNKEVIREKKQKLQKGDRIRITVLQEKEQALNPRYVPLNIVYEDDFLLVIEKPAGYIVHPAPTTSCPSIVEGLLHRSVSLSSGSQPERPGVIHRLDRETAGLLIVAKDNTVHKQLALQMKKREIKRLYQGVVWGLPQPPEGKIETFYGRHPKKRHKMAVLEKSDRKAATCYRVIQPYNRFSLLEFELLTGRTHQIRVHMNHIGTPVVGDSVYGFSREKAVMLELGLISSWKALRQYPAHLLFACMLSFKHPVSKEPLTFYADIPDFFSDFLVNLSK